MDGAGGSRRRPRRRRRCGGLRHPRRRLRARARRSPAPPRRGTGRTGGARMKDAARDPLAAVNPLALCLAAVLYSAPLLTSVDVVSGATALGISLVLLSSCGIAPLTIVKRTWPLLLAAPLSGLSMLLYADPGGTVHLTWWLVTVSDNSIELALAITVRVLAIGVPTLVALVGIDPTRLADALAQIARLPSRFVLGALAAV